MPGAASNNRGFPRPVAADSVISLHELESIQREISKHSKNSGGLPRTQPQTGLGTTGSILPQKPPHGGIASTGNLPQNFIRPRVLTVTEIVMTQAAVQAHRDAQEK